MKKTIKVLLLSPLPPPAGGIATWTEQYNEWTRNNGVDVDIVNTAVIGKRAKKINDKTLIKDEIARTYNIIKNLNNAISKDHPSIIHLNSPCGKLGIIRDSVCAYIAKKKNIPLIVHYRCNVRDQVDNSIVSRFFLKKISEYASLNIVLNNDSKEYIRSNMRQDSIILANFIKLDHVIKQPKDIRKKIEVISFVGHIQKTKGVFEIIEAAKKLPEITFKLGGPVSNQLEGTYFPPNISFEGVLSPNEVRELFLESDLFLFPSYTEGFSNVMLEAMASGLPIVATSVGSNSEMIQPSGGIIIKKEDVEGIVRAVKHLSDPNIRCEMSKWNIRKVVDQYSVDNVMKELVGIYHSVLNS